MNEKDKAYMARAIALANEGIGSVNPNPLVGAVIVKDNKIISEGYHEKFGGPHAEVNAFNHTNQNVEGATMYVTLEPCSHYGKTPPCALKIIEKGIKKVVISQLDPNPLVNGKGVRLLEEAGIEVAYGLLEKESKIQNEVFLHYIKHKTPYVVAKYAMTLDGKIQTSDRDSKWITNGESRAFVHELRNRYMSILVGVQTVIDDDPMLTTRLDRPARNPIRIILDPNHRLPLGSKIVQTAKDIRTIVVSKTLDPKLIDYSIESLVVEDMNYHNLLVLLGKMNIDSILIEGGSTTLGLAMDAGIIHKVYAFIAPKIVGGKGLSPISGEGVSKMKDAITLTNQTIHTFGEDILIEGYIQGEQK